MVNNFFTKMMYSTPWICFPLISIYQGVGNSDLISSYSKVSSFLSVMVVIIFLSKIKELRSKSLLLILTFLSLSLFSYEILVVIQLFYDISLFTRDHSNMIISILVGIFLTLLSLSLNGLIDLKLKTDVDSYIHSNQLRTTTHEVGHLLSYGLLKQCPRIKVKIVDTKTSFFIKEYLGYVEREDDVSSDTKYLLEWHMRMLLSGKEMEFFIFKDAGLGAINDYQRWIKIAKKYLEAGHGDIYYSKPKNKEEIIINTASLNNLKIKLEKEIHIFFSVNETLIKEVIDVLYREKYLDNDSIHQLLKDKVIPTKDMDYI